MNIQNINKRDVLMNNENCNSKFPLVQHQNSKIISQDSNTYPREFGKDITNVMSFDQNMNFSQKDNLNVSYVSNSLG